MGPLSLARGAVACEAYRGKGLGRSGMEAEQKGAIQKADSSVQQPELGQEEKGP